MPKKKGWKEKSNSDRERDRAHALLLSSNGYSIEQLSEIFEVRRAALGEWFDRWGKLGLKGLPDTPKDGRPSIFTKSEQKNYS